MDKFKLNKLIPTFVLGWALLTVSDRTYAIGDDIPPPPIVAPAVLPTDTPVPYHYKVPQRLSDDWPVADLRKEKVDFQWIAREVELIPQMEWQDIHSLLVFRHGKLLLEAYFKGQTADMPQPLFSCTKSVFSTIYGIAQDQGLLSVDQKLYDLYPGQQSKPGWDPRKADITLGNLLSMTSGLDNGPDGSMASSKDWLAHCFELPMAHAPGQGWIYNGGCLSLVSNLIALKSGMSFPEFASKYLLEPLGINGSNWVTGPNGVNRVDYGLAWKSRDIGKLGQLYLNKGMWKGKRILSEEWIKDATSIHAPPGKAFGDNYGYLWYVTNMHWNGQPVSVFNASGLQGQAIYVSPDADLVCVMTAGSSDNNIYGMEMYLFEKKILAAFR